MSFTSEDDSDYEPSPRIHPMAVSVHQPVVISPQLMMIRRRIMKTNRRGEGDGRAWKSLELSEDCMNAAPPCFQLAGNPRVTVDEIEDQWVCLIGLFAKSAAAMDPGDILRCSTGLHDRTALPPTPAGPSRNGAKPFFSVSGRTRNSHRPLQTGIPWIFPRTAFWRIGRAKSPTTMSRP